MQVQPVQNMQMPQLQLFSLQQSNQLFATTSSTQGQQPLSGDKNPPPPIVVQEQGSKPQGGHQPANQKNNTHQGGRLGKQKVAEGDRIQPLDHRHKDLICYNPGGPGHYVGIKPKICFMCNNSGHHMDYCPVWGKEIPMAQFVGSANGGLGFFPYKH